MPDGGDDKERLRRLGFDVLLQRERVVALRLVLWVQVVKVVRCFDYFGGDQTRLSRGKAVGGIGEATVCVLGARMFVAPVRGGAAGAMPRGQARVAVHVVGAFALGRAGARARPGRGRARSQAAVLGRRGAGGGARGGAGRAGVDAL